MKEEESRKTFISVEDRLPGDGQTVMVFTDCKECPVHSATYFTTRGIGYWSLTSLCLCESCYKLYENLGSAFYEAYSNRVTHWFPAVICRDPASDTISLPAIAEFKFSTDVLLLESFLKQFDIKYEESDLEMTDLGPAIRRKGWGNEPSS